MFGAFIKIFKLKILYKNEFQDWKKVSKLPWKKIRE